MNNSQRFGPNESYMKEEERRAKLSTLVRGGLDADNHRFLTRFGITSDVDRAASPVDVWVKARAVMGPKEWVPTKYLVPDWIEFWQKYAGGKYNPGAQTAVFCVGSLQRAIRNLYRPDDSVYPLNDKLANLLDPIRPSKQMDSETGEIAAGLSGIRLLTHGRTLGEKVNWKALGMEPYYSQQRADDNSGMSDAQRKAERKENSIARRRENKLFMEAVSKGLPARLAQEALRTLPMDMAFVPALEYMMRFSDDIFG
jgi:hypothetical protein